MTWTRREFLRVALGSGVGLGVGGGTLPSWLLDAAQISERDRMLVVLELTGGNDALNMVIPHGDDVYHRSRPRLRVPSSQILPLDDHFGLHPRMGALHTLHDAGRLAIVQGVGYENPNRSHFRALDIWHSAEPTSERPEIGWVGRAADRQPGGSAPFAMRLGGRDLPLLLRSRQSDVPTLDRLDDYRWVSGPADQAAGRKKAQAALVSDPRPAGSGTLEAVRRATAGAMEAADRFSDAVRENDKATYPGSDLARRLRLTAALLDARVGPRVTYVNQTGYDTHARQASAHPELLAELSAALGAFFTDLDQRGLSDRVLVMVYSEFGRRVAENDSAGTDHGAAAPVLLLSGAVKAGFHGKRPSLTNLDDGDLRYTTDFRRVYATLLGPWLGVDPAPIIGGSHRPLDVV